MKFITYCFRSILFAAMAISLPANGMFRSAALARSNAFKQYPSAALQRMPKATKSTIPASFAQKEKKQEYNQHKQQFKKDDFEFEPNNTKSRWTIAGIAAGLAAWGLYSTTQAEEDNKQGIEKELNKLIDKLKDTSLSYQEIDAFLRKKPTQKSVDDLVFAIVFNGHYFGYYISDISDEAYQTICESLLRNFIKIVKKSDIASIFRSILMREIRSKNQKKSYQSEIIKILIQTIESNISDILQKDSGLKLLALLLDSDYEQESLEMLKRCKKNPASLARTILKKAKCDHIFENVILENHDTTLENFIRLLTLIELCKKGESKIVRENLTQTEMQLLDNKTFAINSNHPTTLTHYLHKRELMDFVEEINAKERELKNQGFYTLVHGQQKDLYFPSRLYTLFFEISQKRESKDFIFPWLTKPVLDLSQESTKREYHLKNDLPRTWYRPQPNILFLNYGIWSNLHEPTENSAWYAMRNSNFSSINVHVKNIFTNWGYEALYNQFEQEIQSIAIEYLKISNYGNMLLFGIPKEKINQVVYPALPWGDHIDQSASERFEELLNGKDEETYHKYKIFCMPMTFDMALNPHSGIKIFPFISGDADKLKQLKAKEDALFAKIRTAVFKQSDEYAKIKDTRKYVRDLLSTVQN